MVGEGAPCDKWYPLALRWSLMMGITAKFVCLGDEQMGHGYMLRKWCGDWK